MGSTNKEVPIDTQIFIETLHGEVDSNIHVRAIYPNNKKPPKQFNGSIFEYYPQLAYLNKQGYGIYMQVNQSDGTGYKKENITGVNAFFMDYDDVNKNNREAINKLKPKPTFTTGTSPNKYHVYYVFNELQPIDGYEAYQRQLAMKFDTDKSVCDLSRIMRMPGFYHTKGEPYLASIVVDNNVYYEQSDIIEPFNLTKEPITVQRDNTLIGQPIISNDRWRPTELQLNKTKQLLSYIPPDCQYMEWRNVIAGVVDKHGQFASVIDLLDEWSSDGKNIMGVMR